jgi:curved DNA-binding protein CbpA
MMDPYKVLGLRNRKASAEAIRAAHRKRARQTHPDRNGGDDAEFKDVQEAYRILSDPVKRAKYDSSGTIDPDVPDAALSQALSLMAQAFSAVMQDVVQRDRDPAEEDLVAKMKVWLTTQGMAPREQLGQLKRAEQTLLKAVGRFQTEGGENHLERMLQTDLEGVRKGQATIEAQLVIHGRACELLRAYTYRRDEKVREYGRLEQMRFLSSLTP